MMKLMIGAAACFAAAGTVVAATTPLSAANPAATTRTGNYDAMVAAARSARAAAGARIAALDPHGALAQAGAAAARSVPAQYDATLGRVNFAWTRGTTVPAVGALQLRALAEARARAHLAAQRADLGIPAAALAGAVAFDVQDSGRGPVLVRFAQRQNGIAVFKRTVGVLMDASGRLVAVSGSFAPVAKTAPAFALDAPQAIAAAFADMGGDGSALALTPSRVAGDYQWYEIPRLRSTITLSTPPRAKKVLFEAADHRLVPGWYVELIGGRNGGGELAHGYVISATDGSLLFRKDLIAYEGGTAAFSYRVFADANGIHQPYDSPLGNGHVPFLGAPTDTLPRTSGTANLITLVSGPISKQDAWLAAGATTTTGNNADAYLDSGPQVAVPINSPVDLPTGDGYVAGSGDVRSALSSPAAFDYPIHGDDDPSTPNAQQAAIVNLFYMNNWLHDWWYDHGFDEQAGNGQTSNYGRGGVEGDYIKAEGQDGSGRNNANMATPADGGNPRMQMYLFDGPIKGEVCQRSPNNNCLTAPAGTGPTYKFAGASFGPSTFDVEAAVAVPNDQSDPATNGCNDSAPAVPDPTGLGLSVSPPGIPDPTLLNKIALIDRGSCNFTTKEQYAMLSGASALVVINNGDGDPSSMGNADIPLDVGLPTTDTVYQLPAVMIRKDVGAAIKATIAAGKTVTLHLQRLASVDYDGTLDELVIAHEFFHHVSNRLVNDGSGLGNQQGGGMGEGWSDFDALLLSVRPEDQALPGNDLWQAAFPSGFYVIPSDYFGIRRQPYSTDFTKNSLTFKHIQDGTALDPQAPIGFGADGATNSEVHNTGEVWAEMLWSCYAGILDTSDNGSFLDKQGRMKDYVITGLKMTPSDPTFINARDGVLAAAYATNYKDYMACARGFAKRGAGVYAVGPASASTDNVGVTENGIALVADYAVEKVEFVYDKACDADAVLDSNESGTFKLTFRNTGTYVSDVPLTATVSTTASGITLGNGGGITLPAVLKYGETATVNLPVSAATLASSPLALPLSVKFDPVAGGDAAVQQPSATAKSFYVNHDGGTRASDDMEDPRTSALDWTTENTGATWAVKAVATTAGTGMAWFVDDPAAASDAKLVTPYFAVPAGGSFSLDFTHFYEFEAPLLPVNDPIFMFGQAYDGGVIEVSVDGGVWTDVIAYGATFTKGAGYNGTIQSLGGRDGFTDTNSAKEAMTLDFGTKLAGHGARIRFRSASDSAGAGTGWTIDDVKLNGTIAPVFSTLTPEDGICITPPIVVDAGGDQTVAEHPSATDASFPSVKLVGTVGGGIPAGRVLRWAQTSGPAVTLSDASSLTPTFTAPKVSADTPLGFRLMVTDTDGGTGIDDVLVTIRNVNLRPAASAGPDATVKTGGATTLDGSGSSDPDADTLGYSWTQTAGTPVTLSGASTAKPSFTPTADGVYGFTVTVSDPGGETASDAVSITAKSDPVVTPPPVTPPTTPVTPAPGTTDDSRLGGGGAFGGALMLPLLVLVALRRRRRG